MNMKKVLAYVAVSLLGFSSIAQAAADKKDNITPSQSAIKDLIEMSKQIKSLNYTLYFGVYNTTGYTAYRFNNYFVNDIRYAELSNLDGPVYNVYLKGDLIGNSSYALKGTTFNVLPNVFNANFSKLSQNYLMAKTGQARVADKQAVVYDITNKYSNLYSYRVAIDTTTKLPLKVDLLYRDLVSNSYTILNSFSTIYLELGMDQQSLAKIQNAVINTNSIFGSSIDQKLKAKFEQIINIPFLPPGFTLKSNNEVSMVGNSLIANESTSNSNDKQAMLAQTYSDGLFSFTIYVSENEVTTNDHYYWQQGETTLYAEDYAKRKLIIVGQIPLSLAKGIINSVTVKNSQGNYSHPTGFGQQLNTQQ